MASEGSSSRMEAHLDTLLVVRPSSSGYHTPQEFRGSAFVLSHYSPFLRAALAKEWAQGDGKRVELSADPQAFGHLLNFMHSLGDADKLPSDAEALMHLLTAAHALGVERCVEIAAARLAAQAGGLDWDAAVRVLALLEGRYCENGAASSQLELLREAALCRLLHLLGSLDAMLNDEEQRERFCQLPLDVLEALFASDDLGVDCEETAFCAFAHWISCQRDLALEERSAAAAACILPHIRFATMRATSVVNYWHAYRWFRAWDPDRLVLMKAIVAIAEPPAAAVRPPAKRKADDASIVLARRKSCPAVPSKLEFISEIDASNEESNCLEGSKRYWAGAWWHPGITPGSRQQGAEERPLFLKLICGLPPGTDVVGQGMVGPESVGPTLDFGLAVADYVELPGDGFETNWRSAVTGKNGVFRPLKPDGRPAWAGRGWAKFPFKVAMPGGSPIGWTNFRQRGSPIVRAGKMLVQVTASLAGR